jgi:pimeloyl-ACP methyl ester carboxylesterase
MKFKTSDGVTINFEYHKSKGVPLVLVHGAGGDLMSWRQLTDVLIKRNVSVIELDLRNHGLSKRLRKYNK